MVVSSVSARIGAAPHAHGFTLIEMMIAIGILGFVMAAIYSTWSAVGRSTRIGLDSAARVQRTRMAMRVVVDTLTSTELFTANTPYYAFIADTSSDYAYLSVAASLPRSFPRSGLYGDFTLRRVTFSVESGPNGNQLMLWQEPLLMETNSSDEMGPLVVASDLSMFVLEFWDTRANKWVEEWLPTNQLPKLVRVTMGFGQPGPGRTQEIYTRTVAMPAMAIPREYQLPPAAGQPPRPVGARPGPGGAQPQVPGPLDGGGPRNRRGMEMPPGGPGGRGTLTP
jgi:prepilin-type N-terminal cleavage/methylation domain-containing protein